jgi:DHA1 family inner membrane transport protein
VRASIRGARNRTATRLRVAPTALGHDQTEVSARGELAAVRPWQVWVALGTMVLAQAGFLGAYSYISPVLTDRAGIPARLVPLVLVGFGIGALIGTTIGGRLGDRHPLSTVAGAVTLTALALAVLAAISTHVTVVVGLVVLLGATGLGANPVMIAQTLRHAGRGSALASSLAVSAFNLGTAAGTALAGATLSTSWGLTGPAALGTVVTGSALPLITLLALNATRGRRGDAPIGSCHADASDHDTTGPACLTR